MLDLVGIIFSSVIMFLVILRAIQLDATQPWFRPPRTGTDRSGLKLRPEDVSGDDREARRTGARRSGTRSD
jgi:hypothetical protein